MSNQNQNSQFIIHFGFNRILDKVTFVSLSQVFEAISENLFMFENDSFYFEEHSITIEILTEDENFNHSYKKLLKIPVSNFNLIRKMNLHI
jgi:hypothetical protein